MLQLLFKKEEKDIQVTTNYIKAEISNEKESLNKIPDGKFCGKNTIIF